jgi:hypothetical protein
MKSKGLPTGFVQAIGMAPKILPRFYETTSATQLRGRDVDVSDDATIKATDVKTTSDLDKQITETQPDPNVLPIGLPKGNAYVSPQGDTYTSTGDGGFTFTPSENKPAVEQATQSGVRYGAGRGRSTDAGTGGTPVNYSGSGGTSNQQAQAQYSSMYKDTDKPEGDAGI